LLGISSVSCFPLLCPPAPSIQWTLLLRAYASLQLRLSSHPFLADPQLAMTVYMCAINDRTFGDFPAINDCTFGDFPAKIAVHTPYIYFWPTPLTLQYNGEALQPAPAVRQTASINVCVYIYTSGQSHPPCNTTEGPLRPAPVVRQIAN